MRKIIATFINLYHVCHRELWLHANGITMEQHSDLVAEGRQIHEYSYPQRSSKYTEVQLEGIKIDFFDAKNKVVHELKKSDKLEQAHIAQLKYYLFVLLDYGVEATGVLEYPKLRKTKQVFLTEEDKTLIPQWIRACQTIVESEKCPEIIPKNYCKTCSYREFCYS